MKKLFKTNRLSVLSALSASLLLLGCTNADYDLDKLDYTLGFGGGELTLPANNTVSIELDDILNLGNSDLIRTQANGDYLLGKLPEAVTPISVTIEPLVQTINESGEQSFAINIPDAIKPFAGTVIDLKQHLGKTLDADGDVSLISYRFDVDPVVKELNHVGVGGSNGVNLRLELTLPLVVKKFAKVAIQLPRNFVMTYSGTTGTFDNTDNANTLTLTDYDPSEDNGRLSMTFNVTGINVKTYDDKDYVTYDPDKAEMILISNIGVQLEIESLQVPTTPSIEIKGTPTFDQIVVTSARGIFDPDINLDNVGTVTIHNIPDFLTNQDVVADIANPQIWVTLKTNMPLGGEIDATISSDTYPQGIQINNINLKPKAEGDTQDAETKLVICRQAPEDLNGFEPIIIENLSKLIETLRDGMQLSFRATKAKAKPEVANVELGKEYHLTPSYEFTAALALGDNAVIVYSDQENDINDDIEDLQLSAGAKVLLTANVENGVPADVEIDLTPLGKNGQPLSVLTVTPIKNKVAAGATDSGIEYEITDVNGNGLQQLDGIEYRLTVTAPSDADKKGQTLNKNQQILLKDIKLVLNGQVVYDAN